MRETIAFRGSAEHASAEGPEVTFFEVDFSPSLRRAFLASASVCAGAGSREGSLRARHEGLGTRLSPSTRGAICSPTRPVDCIRWRRPAWRRNAQLARQSLSLSPSLLHLAFSAASSPNSVVMTEDTVLDHNPTPLSGGRGCARRLLWPSCEDLVSVFLRGDALRRTCLSAVKVQPTPSTATRRIASARHRFRPRPPSSSIRPSTLRTSSHPLPTRLPSRRTASTTMDSLTRRTKPRRRCTPHTQPTNLPFARQP